MKFPRVRERLLTFSADLGLVEPPTAAANRRSAPPLSNAE